MATVGGGTGCDADDLVRLMTGGGDERIALDPVTGLNFYLCAPRPSPILAYSSSTANHLSAAAFDHLAALPAPLWTGDHYGERLAQLRTRLRNAYRLADDVQIIFAPSGTDLEYAALACVPGAGRAPLINVLLGAAEVGSGCIHSAQGKYFASRTALGIPTRPGAPVEGLRHLGCPLLDVPVRDRHGRVRSSAEIAASIADVVRAGQLAGRHVLVHIVHGSKTGLVLPDLVDVDRLTATSGGSITWAVDACQARIEPAMIHAYLARGAIVFVTGSKFMGGPPFSGIALVPPQVAGAADPMPEGFRSIFLNSEWPASWPGADRLILGCNPGLLLRLEAAIFELERYHRLSRAAVDRVCRGFDGALDRLAGRIGARRGDRDRHRHAESPEERTLSTFDLSPLAPGCDFDDARRWHHRLIAHGVRLGQPVRCGKLPDGRWRPTLRIGLSMPMIVETAHLDGDGLAAAFDQDMARIGKAILACIDPARGAAPAMPIEPIAA